MKAKAPYIAPYCAEPVKILCEEDAVLMVNKPGGLLSVPGRHPENKDCLISRIQLDYPSARIVNRLDMDTSGVMVVALDADIHRQLSRQFEQRLPDKCYEAVVDGLIEKDSGEIDLPLCCDWPNRPKQKVDYAQGKPALTYFRVISRDHQAATSRVELVPYTGRSHQLRIHMAAIGHPILGCSFYGGNAEHKAKRLMLHARSLTVQQPSTGQPLTGLSPTPF